jgi:hypothetical protein
MEQGQAGVIAMRRAEELAAAFVASALLVGCASSTGTLPAGPDTYTISEKFAPVRGGGNEAQRDALTQANAFCSQQGRVFVPSMMGDAAHTGRAIRTNRLHGDVSVSSAE